MAVRGYLTIKERAGSYTLYRNKADDRVLTPDEKQIAAVLFGGRDQLWLHNESHTVIKAGVAALKSWLKLAEDKIYFFTNRSYLLPDVLFSVAMVLGVAAMQSPLSLFGTVFNDFRSGAAWPSAAVKAAFQAEPPENPAMVPPLSPPPRPLPALKAGPVTAPVAVVAGSAARLVGRKSHVLCVSGLSSTSRCGTRALESHSRRPRWSPACSRRRS